MQKYRKTALVEAIQLNWKNLAEIRTFMGDIISSDNPMREVNTCIDACGEFSPYLELTIPTLEGDHTARHGDWIAKGVSGEFWPIKPDIFAATYEPA